jgi:hypothetical protein
MQSRSLLLSLLSTVITIAACGTNGEGSSALGSGGEKGSGGTQGAGGDKGSGGTQGSGGDKGSGGTQGTGGVTSSGGTSATGGIIGHGGSGGLPSTGGVNGSGGVLSTGGINGSGGRGSGGAEPSTGGRIGSGGQAGTTTAIGGMTGSGGRTGAGGNVPTGGSTSTSTGGGTGTSTTVDCNAAIPSGGTKHSGNSQGGSGNLAWQIWTNSGTGYLTTFSTPAFSASWGGTGDYLGRLGFEWGNGGKAYTSYGTITADVSFKKSGSGGGFSYIGIYGWSNNPCVEYYIIDDSMGSFPFSPYNSSQKGTATIDGETYKLFSNQTNGTGGSRCNQSSWGQFWSVRQKARQCGTITISDHFKAWDAAGMKLGSMIEAKILVETGGGSGSVDFAVANMKTSQ